MSEKELFFRLRRWVASLYLKRYALLALLCFMVVMWATPWGIKWLLVQQLEHTLKREVTLQSVHVYPWSLSFSVDGLSVKNTEGGELAGWRSLTVDVSANSFIERALVLDALTLQGPRVSVVHLGEGRFDFSDLLDGPQHQHATALAPFVLREVTIHDGRLSLEDRPFQRTHTVEHFKLTLPLVNSLSGKDGLTLKPELSATFNGAPLHLYGLVQPLADVPDGALTFSVEAFDLSALQPYVPQTLSMRLVSGKLSADLKLQFSEVAGRVALQLKGVAQLKDVLLNDVHDHALLSFKALTMSLEPSDVLTGPVAFSNVTLEEPQAALRVSSEGRLNWADVLSPAKPEQTKPIATKTPLVVQVDQFNLGGGVMTFSDVSVKPTVQTRITDMSVVMKDISTQPGSQADLTFKANLDSAAPLSVLARLQPLNVTAFLDAKLQASGVNLARVSGYAQRYLGYPINQGKLSVEASYRIRDQKLQAENHVVIDHLNLGEQSPSPYAIDAPVSLGVSLLKNSSGQIDIDLPIAGAVDAPEFSFGGLVAQTVGNVLVKVVTAPVRAIGSLLSDDGKED